MLFHLRNLVRASIRSPNHTVFSELAAADSQEYGRPVGSFVTQWTDPSTPTSLLHDGCAWKSLQITDTRNSVTRVVLALPDAEF
jgi:hypothetical protein